MILARGNSVEAARLLIERGADVNATETWRQQTALIWAAAQNQPAMVELLLEHGADPDARSETPEWQRQVSAEKRRFFRPFGGLTALLYAAREGCVGCARALVEGGADIDLSGYRGITPLIMALDNYHFDLAAYSGRRWRCAGRMGLVGTNAVVRRSRHEHSSAGRAPGLAVDRRRLPRSRSSKRSSRAGRIPTYSSSFCRRFASAARIAVVIRCLPPDRRRCCAPPKPSTPAR